MAERGNLLSKGGATPGLGTIAQATPSLEGSRMGIPLAMSGATFALGGGSAWATPQLGVAVWGTFSMWTTPLVWVTAPLTSHLFCFKVVMWGTSSIWGEHTSYYFIRSDHANSLGLELPREPFPLLQV